MGQNHPVIGWGRHWTGSLAVEATWVIFIVGKQPGRIHPESLSESGANGNSRGAGASAAAQDPERSAVRIVFQGLCQLDGFMV